MHKFAIFGKRALVISALLMGAQYMIAAYTIVIHRVGGENESIMLEKRPIITFDVNDMLVNVEGSIMAFARNEVSHMDFSEISAVREMPGNMENTIQVIDNNTFRFRAAKSTVGVFDMAGHNISKAVSTSDGECFTVNLASCPAGIYTITYNNKSIKIIKK